MAGKTGNTEVAFNPEYTSDQWVIGYTRMWSSATGSASTTDENHLRFDLKMEQPMRSG